MPSLKQIKTRIKSTQNLKKITKALEVVSTVKLQKNKARTEHMRDYFIKLAQLIAKVGDYTNLFRETVSPTSERNLVILISSDKGLCGASNSKLFKSITEQYREHKDQTDLFVIGKKWFEFAARSGYTVVGNLMLGDDYVQSDLAALFAYIDINAAQYRSISIVFNFFKNILIQIPQSLTIYPLDINQVEQLLEQSWLTLTITQSKKSEDDTLIEPGMSEVNKELLRQIKQYIIMSALQQNKLTEHAQRMIAMKWAKDNCGQLIDGLTLQYNKARQAAITKEISEIVSAKIAIEG